MQTGNSFQADGISSSQSRSSMASERSPRTKANTIPKLRETEILVKAPLCTEAINWARNEYKSHLFQPCHPVAVRLGQKSHFLREIQTFFTHGSDGVLFHASVNGLTPRVRAMPRWEIRSVSARSMSARFASVSFVGLGLSVKVFLHWEQRQRAVPERLKPKRTTPEAS